MVAIDRSIRFSAIEARTPSFSREPETEKTRVGLVQFCRESVFGPRLFQPRRSPIWPRQDEKTTVRGRRKCCRSPAGMARNWQEFRNKFKKMSRQSAKKKLEQSRQGNRWASGDTTSGTTTGAGSCDRGHLGRSDAKGNRNPSWLPPVALTRGRTSPSAFCARISCSFLVPSVRMSSSRWTRPPRPSAWRGMTPIPTPSATIRIHFIIPPPTLTPARVLVANSHTHTHTRFCAFFSHAALILLLSLPQEEDLRHRERS